jgi:xanthine dehydrogenase small subunit
MAGTPARAYETEKALIGAPWSQESIDKAMVAMASDFQPMSDWRAGSEYRMLASQNLLKRFYLETTTDETVQVAFIQASPEPVVGQAGRS